MRLKKGSLFHNRYLLDTSLGVGASAEVWMARDTKANNLAVAIKIFTEHSEMDSYGLMNFEREFTTVYNMKHTNLLPPTGYDICNGRPYLIMQYCENGSSSSMIGRVEEADIIKFLHDVSAGLEYLHDHNIFHLDIKPDNILLDDSCNFMVTDFGISVHAQGQEAFDANGMSGGTRAYMGPERFQGETCSASDMWSLGATAVELLTGNAPYGEHGGLLQTQGEPLPELPGNLQPEVKSMILSCLTADPAKRIKANEIRQKIELYWETNSWTHHSNRGIIATVATAVACIAVCAAIFLWDYNRTKVRYYKDYTEYWGVPKGFGRLYWGEQNHRRSTYLMEYRRGKLQHMALVNSAGKVVSHTDTEHMVSRFSEVYYYYTGKGRIDYKEILNDCGRILFKMDYDENLKTVTFRQTDEYGTEMNFDVNANQLYRTSALLQEKSAISRHLLSYNEQGLLTQRRYVGLQNVPAGDKDKIYGESYTYDEQGHLTEIAYLGIDGNVKANDVGLAIRVYGYDEDNNWTSTTYLTAERSGSHDGQNCSIVRLSYDKYGNRIRESYYDIDGKPSIRTDMNVSGIAYTYDERGNEIRRACYDVDGKPTYTNDGYVAALMTYNDNGYLVSIMFVDENNNPVLYSDDSNSCFASRSLKVNDRGLTEEIRFYDENGKLINQPQGNAILTLTYDDRGNQTGEHYFDSESNPVAVDGFYCGVIIEYDDLSRCTRIYYVDADGELTTQDGVTADYHIEYNRQGAVTKVTMFNEKGQLQSGKDVIAGYTIEYDPTTGLRKASQNFDQQGKACANNEGTWRTEYVYDPATGNRTEITFFDVNKKEINTIHYRYNEQGFLTSQWSTVNGKLVTGTVVEVYEPGPFGRDASITCQDLDGKKVVKPGTKYAVVRYEYDHRGNNTVETYWNAADKPTIDEMDTHRRVREFDALNRITHMINYGVDGKPIAQNAEARTAFDRWGNLIEISTYDGQGKACLSANGSHAVRWTYDSRRRVIHEEYVGVDGSLMVNANTDYAKADYTYDKFGNKVLEKYYDTKKCYRIDSTYYNSRNRITRWVICDGQGRRSDEVLGFSLMTITYEDDQITPAKRLIYSAKGVLMASQKWDAKNNQWEGGGVSSNSWIASVRSDAEDCPQELVDDVYVQSINYTSSSVTVTFKLTTVSKYNLDDDFESTFRDLSRKLSSHLRDSWDLPSNVKLRLIFTDKADRTLYTY